MSRIRLYLDEDSMRRSLVFEDSGEGERCFR